MLLCYTPEEHTRNLAELGIVRTATAEGVELLELGARGRRSALVRLACGPIPHYVFEGGSAGA